MLLRYITLATAGIGAKNASNHPIVVSCVWLNHLKLCLIASSATFDGMTFFINLQRAKIFDIFFKNLTAAISLL